jgi:uncharacterized membrane protein YsdA (DUF1294 family)
MIERRKFWSNPEDTLLISSLVISTLGLYVAAAYFIITML